jgi:anaerobic magnesium-protoporphyrin IX monomethyl ester cyclase
VEQIYQAARRLHEAGIEVGFFLQFGYPGETRADVDRTLQMVRDCQPDDIGVSVSYPLPGTVFYDRVRAELGEKQNWQDSEDLSMLYHGTFSTEFYRVLHQVVHAEFRLRSNATRLQRDLAHPGQLRASHVRLAASLPLHALRLFRARARLARLESAPAHQPSATTVGAA